tara:strand:+ start:518 stop:1741 length:1224 start_codon:yes stop_codon:yes gene_type:complete
MNISPAMRLYFLVLSVISFHPFTIDLYAVLISDPEGNGSFLGIPENPGSFRPVLYNHGGMGSLVGGDMEMAVQKLAEAGLIGYAQRRTGTSVPDTLTEVQNGIDDLLDLAADNLGPEQAIDLSQGVSLIGYSRGGLLALKIAELKTTKTQEVTIDKVIIMAAAPGKLGEAGHWVEGGATSLRDYTTMDEYLKESALADIDENTSEFFLLAANNDQPPDNPNNNLVDLVSTVHERLTNRTGTPVESTLKIFDDWDYGPPHDPSGHTLFESQADGGQALQRQTGFYWLDVIRFLEGEEVTLSTLLNESPAAMGDANLDGVIDVGDLGIVGSNYNMVGMEFTDGDFNEDRSVNITDLGILGAHWSVSSKTRIPFTTSVDTLVSVPEPQTFMMILAAITCYSKRRYPHPFR